MLLLTFPTHSHPSPDSPLLPHFLWPGAWFCISCPKTRTHFQQAQVTELFGMESKPSQKIFGGGLKVCFTYIVIKSMNTQLRLSPHHRLRMQTTPFPGPSRYSCLPHPKEFNPLPHPGPTQLMANTYTLMCIKLDHRETSFLGLVIWLLPLGRVTTLVQGQSKN